MSTDTTVKQLMINKLTEAQYDTAVQGGVIGPNELSFVTDMDIEVIQVDTMPTADASEAGKIYQYTGATDANYTHGYFYECVGAGSPVVYSWVQTNTQPGQVNADWNSVSGVSQILNKPSLATVATTGDYSDLTNKPTIPAAQVNSDWNANSGVAEILNKPTLGTAAAANSTDFATAAQGTKADSAVQSISTGSTNGTISVDGVDVAVYGLGSAAYTSSTDYATSAQGGLADTAVQPGDLATVAVSGDYNDLLNKPTIPSTANMVTTNTAQTISAKKTTTSQIKLEGAVARIEIGATSSESLPVFERNINTNAIEVGASTRSLNLKGSSNLTYNGSQVAMYSDVSNVQAQLSSKQNTITGAATTITSSNLTPNYALISNASGKVAVSGVTSTQLGYLSTATSNIQTQLNNKQSQIPAGTAGEVVTYSGTAGTVGSTALATVATSGSYSDLSNTPTLGTMAAEDASDYTPTASLATVATSGLYSDLTGTPTIPTVNDATITITQGGVTKGSFTLNQSSGDTIALDAGGGSSLPSQTGHSGEFLTTDGTDASWAAITIPCILLDYVVTASTGVITIETNKAPTTKTVKEVIGGAAIAGTWTTTDTTHYVFTPTTASDILDNANGFMIKVA